LRRRADGGFRARGLVVSQRETTGCPPRERGAVRQEARTAGASLMARGAGQVEEPRE